MSNENETTGGEHNAEKRPHYELLESLPIERPIKIVWDKTICKIRVGDKIETMEVDEKSMPKCAQLPCIYLSIPEFNRGLESYIDYLNQTKNEGRHEIRTIKDKENQIALQAILDVCNLKTKNTQNMTNTELGKFIFEIKSCFEKSIDKNTHNYNP